MIKIEEVCEKISSNISNELNLDSKKKSVINYGVFAFIQMGICILLVMIFGGIFKVFFEALIISFTTSILRKSSGGVHASSPKACAIIGTIFSVVMAIVSKHINISFSFLIFIGVIVFIWAFYIVYKLAPVDSISKPIKNIEKKQKLKRKSIIILIIYLFIIIINFIYFVFMNNSNVLVYSLCIYMGILWQVFSLTEKGHLLISKIDKLIK